MQQARKIAPSKQFTSHPGRNIRPLTSNQAERKQKKAKLLLNLVACFLLSLVVVAQYSSLVIMNFNLSSARAELAQVQESSRNLELQVAELSSISRIEQIARVELGMVDPEIGQLRIITAGLEDNSRLGE